MPRIGAIPIDRENHNSIPETADYIRTVLEGGHLLVMFPEGKRSETGEIQKGQPGVAASAISLDIPIIPTHLSGTGAARSGERWVVRFGKPIYPADFAKEGLKHRALLLAVTTRMMEEIRKLAEEAERENS
jgi:1-acyl-sn-glycerol-3-phosphate acyltransferase